MNYYIGKHKPPPPFPPPIPAKCCAASTGNLQKPDKIYLENTNLTYAPAPTQADPGSLRETFFLNQLQKLRSCLFVIIRLFLQK